MKPSNSEIKVFVGMSGGVDSSVSAALLKRAGYDVTGVFIKVWQPDWIECNWKEERLEAMRAAAHLDIPFFTLDLEKEYKQGVIDYMIAEYAIGRTPNPDVMCNREVKFGAFWRWAEKNGADYIATGHYARVSHLALLMGVDKNKDQSYFLWTLTQDDLAHVMFPVGGLIKPEVRKLARKFGLPNAEKKDSQGLCFMGKVDVKEFLTHYTRGNTAAVPGKVLDETGNIIGSHPGSLFFTIGERHGFSIDSKHKTSGDKPYYVISKDVQADTIMVSNKTSIEGDEDSIGMLPGAVKEVRISKVNWISGVPKIGASLQGRSRYRQTLYQTKVLSISNSHSAQGIEASLEFNEPQDTLTPGQSLVIYDGETCLGGGVIE
jgi:tRNA-specific 2-thiouridylase